jgi:hypothetical protein
VSPLIAEEPADAVASTLFRTLLIAPLWLARLLLSAWALPVDAILVALYLFWVNKPLQASLGPRYAKRPHWSTLFVIPGVFAVFLLLRDVFIVVQALAG